MKITVFTSNQPRHCAYIRDLANIADEVYAVQETLTLFPGEVEDFYRKSETMQAYFSRVIAAEKTVFGDVFFSGPKVRTLALQTDDVSKLDFNTLKPAMSSDLYLVFGASFIKGKLAEFLIEQNAINIHMGTSPYYRGAGCNFWAMYDDNPHLVGATIHRLSKGLDNGAMLFHAFPKQQAIDPFVLGMKSVRAAQRGIINAIRSGDIFSYEPVVQDKSLEIRYTRNVDFTDAVAQEYLDRNLTPEDIKTMFERAREYPLTRPYFDAE